MTRRRPALCAALALALAVAAPARAAVAEALVAVAANFAGALERLAEGFAAETGHRIVVTTGSTGKLYAQIAAGAPFDLLLAADAATPARLEAEGLAVTGAGFTYAIGRMTLWSADPGRIGPDGPAALRDPGLRHVALANPDLAPYGAAAREVVQRLGLWEALGPKLVMGQNIGQTHALVASGAAEVGFVALSAVIADAPGGGLGSRWDVPADLHAPIRQDAALLIRAADNPAAAAFLAYLRSPAAAEVIASFGYGVEAEP